MTDVVPGPEGFLVRVEYGSPGLLPWMLERVADQGLTVQRAHLVPETTSVLHGGRAPGRATVRRRLAGPAAQRGRRTQDGVGVVAPPARGAPGPRAPVWCC